LAGHEQESDDDRRLRDIAIELTVVSYYAATVLEFFARDEDSLIAFLVGDTSPTRLCDRAETTLSLLARARQQFASSPWLAAADVTTFRQLTSLPSWPGSLGADAAAASPGLLAPAGEAD
jgi:hypothetical protein